MDSAHCSSCGAPFTGIACPRCDRPLCPAHVPRPWCEECEREFLEQRNRLRLRWWFLVPFLAPFTYLLVHLGPLWRGEMHRLPGRAFTGHPFSDVLAVVLVAGLLLGGTVAGLRQLLFRWRFAHGGRRGE